MKVKNIMFAGFASAILSGVCGAASAADYNLVTQGYVTEKLSGKVSTETYAQYLEAQEATDKKQTEDIASNTAAINTLSGGEGGEGVATLMQDISALKSAVNDENGAVAQKIATAIATEESRADGKYQEKGDYALKSELPTDYVTSEGLAAEGFLKAETAATTYQPIGDYQPAGSYVTTDALTQEGFLKATTAEATYQPKGNYQEAGDYVTTEEMNTALGDKQDELTEAQLAAVNSTIDAAKVAQIQTNADNIALKANTSDVNTALEGKLDVMENAGTYLVKRDGEGNISYVSVEIVGETPAQE